MRQVGSTISNLIFKHHYRNSKKFYKTVLTQNLISRRLKLNISVSITLPKELMKSLMSQKTLTITLNRVHNMKNQRYLTIQLRSSVLATYNQTITNIVKTRHRNSNYVHSKTHRGKRILYIFLIELVLLSNQLEPIQLLKEMIQLLIGLKLPLILLTNQALQDQNLTKKWVIQPIFI